MVVRMPMVGAMGTWITPGAPNYASLEHSRSSRSRMNDSPRRYHYAFPLHKVRGGWRVEHVIAFASRGEPDRYSLGLLARHADAGSITLERELHDGEMMDAASLKR
jgi:hypothetical protein